MMLILFWLSLASAYGTPLQPIYKWNPQTKEYSVVNDDDHLPAGTVLWIRASAAATLHLAGAYTGPTNTPISEPAYYSVRGLQVVNTSNVFPPQATLAHFDEATQQWRARIADELVSELPESLAPGEAVFIHPAGPAEILAPDPALDIRYYHADHLGSASVISDAQGNVLQE